MLFIIPILQIGKLRLREAMPGFLEKSELKLSLDFQTVKETYLLSTPIKAPNSSHLFLSGVLMPHLLARHPFC